MITVDLSGDLNGGGQSIQDFCDDLNIDLKSDYSGRGMMDKTCVAIVGDICDLMRFALFVLPEFYGNPDRIPDQWEHPSEDSHGTRTVYYWRGIKPA